MHSKFCILDSKRAMNMAIGLPECTQFVLSYSSSDCTKLSTYFLLKRGEASLHRISTIAESRFAIYRINGTRAPFPNILLEYLWFCRILTHHVFLICWTHMELPIHRTTKSDCFVVAMDELPGATAEDYCSHISNSVGNLARVYSHFHDDTDYKRTNHCTHLLIVLLQICLLNKSWNKSLNELKCHLHPLDTIATDTIAALKMCSEQNIVGKVWGKDCIARNIVLAINKLRFKNGKGDLVDLQHFCIDEKLPHGIIPQYRGNRLHILFHICIQYHSMLIKLFETGTSCGGLRSSILANFVTDTVQVEMQVLGLIGKILTGPWMKAFYTSSV